MKEHPDHLRHRVFCSSCGAAGTRRYGQVPVGWQEFLGSARAQALCPKCVRDNLFSIEARLDFDELGF